ncbi:DUF6402 family protein [Erwinia persicina]|uniref:Phage capsid protein n=1 Tax=Erwinia persicina TaxID=55211 RepID=A0ABR8ZZG6_9GAMM|nr:DUF6402 family protein [Erwinia persicina]MBD8108959.1 hypothetical protein [Erwinia persicina]MBD8212058.1 hypothetical protein [Erwinia persicina]
MTVRINLGPYNALEKDTFFLIESQKTRPNGRSSSSEVNIEPLKITDIPAAMRKMGWSKSAALMTRWLKSPAWKCPEAWKSGQTLPKGLYLPDEHCDDMTIKMSWLMQYPYAKKSAEELIRKRAFSPAGLRMIADRLKLLGWDGQNSYIFGRRNILDRPGMSARELEQYYQNNYLAVGDNAVTHVLFDTIDDVFGSLGTYNMKCAVIGTAFRDSDGKVYIESEYVGVYVKDFYDFNNDDGSDQRLGFWTKDSILTRGGSAAAAINGMNVYSSKNVLKVADVPNSDFLAFRETTGLGGDFVVFSDVDWVKIKSTHLLPWEDALNQ